MNIRTKITDVFFCIELCKMNWANGDSLEETLVNISRCNNYLTYQSQMMENILYDHSNRLEIKLAELSIWFDRKGTDLDRLSVQVIKLDELISKRDEIDSLLDSSILESEKILQEAL